MSVGVLNKPTNYDRIYKYPLSQRGTAAQGSQGDFREDYCQAKLGVVIVFIVKTKESKLMIISNIRYFSNYLITIKTTKTNYNKNASFSSLISKIINRYKHEKTYSIGSSSKLDSTPLRLLLPFWRWRFRHSKRCRPDFQRGSD